MGFFRNIGILLARFLAGTEGTPDREKNATKANYFSQINQQYYEQERPAKIDKKNVKLEKDPKIAKSDEKGNDINLN